MVLEMLRFALQFSSMDTLSPLHPEPLPDPTPSGPPLGRPALNRIGDPLSRLLGAWIEHSPGVSTPPLPLQVPRELDAVRAKWFARPQVSIRVDRGGGRREILAASLPGLWLVQSLDSQGRVAAADLELGLCPPEVSSVAAAASSPLSALGAAPTRGISAIWQALRLALCRSPGKSPSLVLNLTQSGLDAADHAALLTNIGQGPVCATLNGLHRTHAQSTRVQHVWRVRYENLAGTLLLDTLEVGALPECLALDRDEIASCLTRLRQWAEERNPT